MADFRRVLVALAVLAVMAVSANAQITNPFACTASAAVPPLLRAEGVTELVGDIVITCTGGISTTAATPLPTANFQVFIGNANVTSRTYSTPFSSSEALLLVDEPNTTTNPAAFAVNGQAQGCPALGTGAAGCVGASTGTIPNVYPGSVSGNSATFIGVPVNPPGTVGVRVFRITNVRVNASAIGATTGVAAPNQVLAFVTISGSISVPLNSPQ